LALVGLRLSPDAVPAVPIRRARFVESLIAREAMVPLDENGGMLSVMSRARFDGWLYERASEAGATALTARLTDLRRDGSAFELQTTGGSVQASAVIAADGANSLVRRRLAGAFRRDQLSIATGYFAHGVTSDEIVIEMTSEPAGYIWSFPRPDHLAIGICAQANAGTTAEALRMRLRTWIEQVGLARGATLEPYSWPIPSLSARDVSETVVSGPGWLAVGDAAGLVDPITREGIFFALQSAAFAADALTSADRDPWPRYAEQVRDVIGSELARAARYKAGFFRPRFNRLLIEALRTSESVRRVMADLVAGTQPYRTLKGRLAQTLELRLAWKLLRSA
jgi:flavin-dependent dehydrogenase